MMKENKEIRVSFVSNSEIGSYDPAKISYADEAVLLRQLFATALLYSPSGKIEMWAANSIEIDSNQHIIQLDFDNKILLANGRYLDAEDFILSLKRLYILNTNSHGNLVYFLGEQDEGKSIEDIWSSLTVKNKKAVIKLKNNVSAEIFIPLLANVDTGVIPKEALNLKDKALPILSYSLTSGPYFFSGYTQKNEKILKKNNNEFYNKYDSPKQIVCVGIWGKESVEALLSDKIDIIPTIDPISANEFQKLEDAMVSKFQTLPVKEYSFTFSNNGIQKFSKEERIIISELLKKAFINDKFYSWSDLVESNQFVSELSEVSIPEAQAIQLNESRQNILRQTDLNKYNPSKKVEIVAFGISEEDFDHKFKKFEWLKRVKIKKEIKNTPTAEQPDIVFTGSDIDFYESASFLFYCITNQKLRLPEGTTKDTWLNEYISEPIKEKRIKKIVELQIFNLENGYINPIGKRPYYAFSKKISFPIMKETPEVYFWLLK